MAKPGFCHHWAIGIINVQVWAVPCDAYLNVSTKLWQMYSDHEHIVIAPWAVKIMLSKVLSENLFHSTKVPGFRNQYQFGKTSLRKSLLSSNWHVLTHMIPKPFWFINSLLSNGYSLWLEEQQAFQQTQ